MPFYMFQGRYTAVALRACFMDPTFITAGEKMVVNVGSIFRCQTRPR